MSPNQPVMGNDYQQPWQKKTTVIEAAASAKEDGLSADTNGKMYSGEVNRTANVVVKDGTKNRDFTYLAVDKLSKICSRCYPDDGNAFNPCERKCCYQNNVLSVAIMVIE